MALKYAILGVLSQGPRHGYAIYARLGELVGSFWPINQGQVYATLGRMSHAGLIAAVGEPECKSSIRHYAIQPSGQRAYQAWFCLPTKSGEGGNELLLKLLFHAWNGERTKLDRLLEQQRARYRAAVASLKRPPLRAESERAAERSDVGSMPVRDLLRRASLRHIEAELDWLDLVEHELLHRNRKIGD